MSDWHRTRLEKKYRAVKMLSASQRTWGDKFTPQFRPIARQLNMKPQNLVFMWKNRDAIVERAKRKLPESVRSICKHSAKHSLKHSEHLKAFFEAFFETCHSVKQSEAF